jgi:hypothetical protein
MNSGADFWLRSLAGTIFVNLMRESRLQKNVTNAGAGIDTTQHGQSTTISGDQAIVILVVGQNIHAFDDTLRKSNSFGLAVGHV